jgi:predicted PurR-regulated permease PerM
MEQTVPKGGPYWTPRKVILATLVVVAVTFGFWLFLRFRLVLFSLFQAIVFGTAISPLVDWLQQRGIRRGLSIAITYVFIMAFVVGFIYLTAPLVIDQAATVSQTITTYYQQLYNGLTHSNSILVERLANRLPPTILNSVPPPIQNGSQSFSMVNQALGYLGVIANSLFAVISVLFLTFYWILDRERILRSLLLLAPTAQRDRVREILATTEIRVGAYVRGVALLCAFIGGMALLSYLLIGLPHALLLGLMAGVLEVVPLVGPVLGALPAVLIALSSDPTKVLWVIAAVTVIQFSENHFLVPRIMNKTVGVNPVVSLLAFAAFSSLFGFAGALLAIPMAVLIQILLDRFLLGSDALPSSAPAGRDRLSLLRYEAQELVQDVRKQMRTKEGDIIDETSDEVEDQIEAIATDLDSILARMDSAESQPEPQP